MLRVEIERNSEVHRHSYQQCNKEESRVKIKKNIEDEEQMRNPRRRVGSAGRLEGEGPTKRTPLK